MEDEAGEHREDGENDRRLPGEEAGDEREAAAESIRIVSAATSVGSGRCAEAM